MADFVGRVSQYPVVEDTCKVASDAYQWAKGNPTVGTLAGKVESAAWSLASMLKPVVNSTIVHKVDDVACRQFLDRFESFCPTLKESSTEELLGPTANRALNLAETCAGYVLPKEDQPEGHTEANDACAEVSRTERLARLRSRAHTQAMAVFHSSIGRAQELIGQLTVHGEQLTKMVSVANISSTLAQITAVLNFAYVSAKTMSIPLVVQGLDVAIHETHNINEQLKDSGRLNWLDLQKVVSGLEHVRNYVAPQSTSELDSEQSTDDVQQTPRDSLNSEES